MKHIGFLLYTFAAALGGGLPAAIHPLPLLLWNASASVPIGLYAVHPVSVLTVGELVVVRPPEALADFLATRRYLPKGVPMLKHVLALPGQTVCRLERTIIVDGSTMGNALLHDSRGRLLSTWRGCERIPTGEVFLMNRQSADSFDGRYFGLLPDTAVLAQATPIWTRTGS